MTKTVLALTCSMLAAFAEAVEVIDPSEVAPGTVGTCITEMDGGEVVEIPLTVLGTVGPWTPEGEIVLVRLEDERFRHTGIIAGMSGSPVYVDGRLLGALAFGWSFAKEPIGGVTPFSRMESLGSGSQPAHGASLERPAVTEIVLANRERRLGALLTSWLLPDGEGEIRDLPVVVTGSAGWSPSGSDWLADSWRRLGWVSVPGGGAGAGASPTAEVAPGAMVAGVLVSGDATLAAGGTVTEVRGDDVWAFGHPFLGAGGFGCPMARARVVTVLPSQASSFKFFTVGETIGSFIEDRSRGIWGRIGEATPMVPVTVTVNGSSYGFDTIRHPGLTPFLVAYVAQASQAARGRLFGEQTVGARVELRYADHEPAIYEETLASGEAPSQVAALAAAVVGYLENSVFEVPALEGIAVTLESEERLRAAELLDAVPERRVVRAGEVLPVRLRLRPFRGPEVARELSIQVPQGMPDGRIDLVVADGASWSLYDLGMRPLEPGSFDDEIRLVNSLLPSTSVVLALESSQPGVSLPGGSIAMPPSLVVQMSGGLGPELATTSYAVVARVEDRMELPVAGAQRIELRVCSECRPDASEVP